MFLCISAISKTIKLEYKENDLINNQEAHQFQMVVDEQQSFIEYKKEGDKMILVHTEVARTQQGKGIARAMVVKTFQYLDEHHLTMVPVCAYIRSFLKNNPQWNRLVED